MADVSEYGKPVMTGLPGELGVSIIKQIMDSTLPDREKIHAECQRLIRENLQVRESEIARRDST